MVEVLMAMMLFLIVSAPLGGVLMASIASQSLSREHTLAEEAAQSRLESVRALPYTSVGTVNGNPPGTLQPSAALAESGLIATVTTRVTYVSDPTPTAYVTRADYKKVTVTVQRAKDQKVLAQEATYVAPPGRGQYGGVDDAIVDLGVVDFPLNTPVVGATVTLGSGPSAIRTDTTDAAGRAVFPSLTANPTSGPQSYYDLTVDAFGFKTLKDDAPPGGAAHVQLNPGQTFDTVLRVYRPATIYVQLAAPGGGVYAGAATVTIGSSRGAQSFAVTGGFLTVTQIGGEWVVPGLNYTVSAQTAGGQYAPAVSKTVPNQYPVDLTSTFALTLGATAYTGSTLTVYVKDAGGAALPGARVDLSGGPAAVYQSATTSSTGAATFSVPAGTGYTVAVTGPGGQGSGSWSGAVPSSAAVTVR